MAAQSIADVVGLHLEQVRKKLPKLFHYNDVTFARIQNRDDAIQVSDRETRVPLQIRPGSRFGSVNMAGGPLGRGTGTKYDKATLTPLSSRIAVEINEDVLQKTKGEPKAIRKILMTEIKNAMTEFRTQMNGQLQTAGDGVLATLSANPSTNTFTVDNSPFFNQLLRAGQIFTVYDSTLTTNRGEAEIISVDYPNNTFLADSTPAGTVSGDKILPEGLTGANPLWYFGIPFHHSDAATGTWLGLSRVTTPEIRASRVNAGNVALTTPPIRLALNKILQRVGQVSPKAMVAHMHTAQSAAYEELAVLISEIKKGSGNEDVDLLFGTARMAGVPTMVDIQAARDRIDFMNFDSWGRVESHPVDFLKQPDGKYIDRPVDTASGSQVAAIIFWIVWFGQFFIDNPASVSYISDLSLPSGYDAI